jgi:hypothetical protein
MISMSYRCTRRVLLSRSSDGRRNGELEEDGRSPTLGDDGAVEMKSPLSLLGTRMQVVMINAHNVSESLILPNRTSHDQRPRCGEDCGEWSVELVHGHLRIHIKYFDSGHISAPLGRLVFVLQPRLDLGARATEL